MEHKRLYIIFLYLLVSNNLFSQNSLPDTVKISEIEIVDKKIKTQGFKQTSLNTDSLSWIFSENIDFILRKEAGIYIKKYGLGGISSSSIRGGAAAQTQVLWNGVNLNSAMLGQTDLSLIPLSSADKISILHGGTSEVENSGGLGGTISLNNSAQWTKSNKISLNAQINNFQTMKFGASAFLKNNFISSKTSFFYSQFNQKDLAEKYRFTLYSKHGIQENLFFKKGHSRLNFHFLSFSKKSILPSSTFNNENTFQKTSILQSNYKYFTNDWQIKINSALLFDNYLYSNKNASIYSENNSFSLQNKLEVFHHFNPSNHFSFGLTSDFDKIKSNNYESIKSQNLSALFFASNWQFFKKVNCFILTKISFLDFKALPFQPSFGTEIQMFNSSIWTTKFSISQNYRLPTFNDKYWIPFGNLKLMPEKGYSGEFGQELSFKNIHLELTYFHSAIQNRIAWIPYTDTQWKPINYDRTRTNGLELNTKIAYKNFEISLFYTYTNSLEIKNPEKTPQIFIPKNQASTNIRIKIQNYNLIAQYQFLGKRPISLTQHLEADHSLDFLILKEFISNQYNIKFTISVNNILDSRTEIMPGYPKAPRNFGFSFIQTCSFRKK